MTLEELRQLATSLHKKANASTGISPREDKNEWMAEKIDQIIESDSYQLEDMLDEQRTLQEALRYIEELYEQEK